MVSILFSGMIATTSAAGAPLGSALQPAGGVKPWANASETQESCRSQRVCRCKILGEGCSGELTSEPTPRFPVHDVNHYCITYGLCGSKLPKHLKDLIDASNDAPAKVSPAAPLEKAVAAEPEVAAATAAAPEVAAAAAAEATAAAPEVKARSAVRPSV